MFFPASAWLHDLDPFLWRLTEDFGVRWYGLSYVAGFVIAWAIIRWLAGRGAVAIPKERAADAVLMLALCAIVGGRLGYALLYQPALLISFEKSFPWWSMVMINKGGMASHGGMAGVMVACFWISRGFKDETGRRVGACPPLHIADVAVMVAPFGIFLGRLANFVNGELLGRVVAPYGEPGPRWGVKFPQEALERFGELSEQQQHLLIGFVNRAEFATDVMQAADPDRAFASRFRELLSRIQQGDAALARELEPIINTRAPSQLLQALAEGLIAGLVVWFIARVPRKPGVVGCWFLMVYGVGRVLTEFVRLPDAHLTTQHILGLSRGQWLSVLMVILGAVLAFVLSKRGEPMGGWLKPASPAAR